jgi:F-type H+-transporting ATPase subunit gamma
MDLVATSKLQKAKARLNEIRPLYTGTKRVLENIALGDETRENIFVMKREIKKSLYIVITSDRGLCGGYNTNVSKEGFLHMADKNENIIAVGAKGWDYFRRRGKKIAKRFRAVAETGTFNEAEQVGELALEMFTSKDPEKSVQEVYIVYTHFESMMTHTPMVERILPLKSGAENSSDLMRYEPDVNTFLKDAIPLYVNTFIYGAMMESASCEQAARMMSMDAAATNAEDIIDDLTLAYNRMRQGIITQEINEIVSGANALQ